MQTARAKAMELTPAQEKLVQDMTEKLPKNWVELFIKKFEEVFDKTYSRQHAYNILKGCRTDHDGWKVLESIAKSHQEVLNQI
ncbi:hypothetical protein V8V91_08705 [Algoriphagus halophilus]|uniref:hypothetical protein n=1 Tax=Algoriphagus halophilus TaxID=226505 RepID=UPI00358E8E0C